ncbi:hypothetical protein QAD02_021287 [Eretmocerus hayati]|uniref:Uncharacterized protein n=1 Tax=Eretmocerus hayati TaxID=131215 RepID=A0ACC2PPH3_9HYME|nr:hypothetical protein QAD02_021287 [Eretmocerus hayati]
MGCVPVEDFMESQVESNPHQEKIVQEVMDCVSGDVPNPSGGLNSSPINFNDRLMEEQLVDDLSNSFLVNDIIITNNYFIIIDMGFEEQQDVLMAPAIPISPKLTLQPSQQEPAIDDVVIMMVPELFPDL